MTQQSKLFTYLAAFAVLILSALIVAKQYHGSRDSSTGSATTVAAIRVPTTSSSNAADSYRQATQLFAALGSSDLDQLDRYADGKIDRGAAEFFQRHEAILGWVRLGAAQPGCDWSQPDMSPRLHSLNSLRGIASLNWGHARFAQQSGDFSGAIDDLLASMSLARHIGMNRLLVDALVQIGIENRSVELLASMLPSLSRDQLKALAQRLDALPASTTGQQLLVAEFDHAQRSIRQQQAGFVSVSMVDSMKGFYEGLGGMIDTQSPADFAKSVDVKMDEYKLNTFAQTAGSTLKRFRETAALLQVRLAMLRCAIEVQADGDAAVARSHDPFDDGAPFTMTRTSSGFTLTSKLTARGTPVSLTAGGQ
jgi:hypothetical protein